MARPIPKLLFRAWSTESHGKNSQTLFETRSQSHTTLSEASEGHTSISELGEKLRAALLWKRVVDNPFIFLSSSLLFVVQLAGRKKAQGEANVHITCVDTEAAVMANGNSAKIHSVNDLLRTHGIEIRNRSDGSLRRYPHEYVALTSLCPKAGSRCVKYESLVSNGLFNLYPQLQDVNQRRNLRLHLAVTDLRDFGFSTERPLTKDEIDVAARLAISFAACTPLGVEGRGIELHLLAWFLSFRKRGEDDAALARWIDFHTSIELENNSQTTFSHAITDLDEIEVIQHKQLLQLFAGRSLLESKVDSSSTINRPIVAREIAEWQNWRRKSKDRHRANRAERVEGHYHQRRRDDRASHRTLKLPAALSEYRQRNRSRSPRRDGRRGDRVYRRRDYDR